MRAPAAADDESAGPRPPVVVEAQPRLRPEQVEPQAALLTGSTAAMVRQGPLAPLTLHEAVLVGTQARTQLPIDVPPRIGAPSERPPYSPVPK